MQFAVNMYNFVNGFEIMVAPYLDFNDIKHAVLFNIFSYYMLYWY